MVVYRTRRSRLLTGVVAFTLVVMVGALYSTHNSNIHDSSFKVRHLLEAEHEDLNCTPRSIDEFPDDFMSEEQRKHGGVVAHILICLYIFAALAIVCDDYFVASLESFSTVLHMQSDVAGATFMAAGSSAPELFTSIVGVFFAKSDVGLGTIVGSAVFNLLAIIAVVAMFTGEVIYLLWWPMTRDCFVYVISVLTLALVIMDNLVTWYESLIMLVLYTLYIVLMVFNQRIGTFVTNKVSNMNIPCRKTPEEDVDTVENQHGQEEPLRAKGVHDNGVHDNGVHDNDKKHVENNTDHLHENNTEELHNIRLQKLKHSEIRGSKNSVNSYRSFGSVRSLSSQIRRDNELINSGIFVRSIKSVNSVNLTDDAQAEVAEKEEFESPLKFPKTWPKRIVWILTLPLSVMFMFTIPDCRRGGIWAKLFPLTFIMSIVWLGALTYVMVWMVTIIGDTLGIPDAVMGLTLLAAGTSIPDGLASLFVAKDGYGDMAVSNSIGSNIFDILLCLGLPWFLQTVVVATGDVVQIGSNGIMFTTMILLATVVFIMVAMLVYGWKLDKKIGVVLLLVYLVVITIACLFEMNVFGDINTPQCS